MTVRVYVERVLLMKVSFSTKLAAIEFAEDYQDRGYRVRMS